MSVRTKTAKASDDQKLHSRLPPSLPATGSGPPAVPRVKEQEALPGGKSEDELMIEITTRADALDREHEAAVRESLAEARRAVPEPAVPPDVEDAGVVSPQLAAEDVVKGGTTLDLPMSESVYKRGLHQKVAGAVKDKVVVGVSSLAALAMWIGRLIKMAHKHTMRIVFRKEGERKRLES